MGSDAESALKEGTVDIVMGIDKSDSSTSFWKSDAYLPTAVALFSAPSNTQVPTNVVETKIAAQVSSKSAWAVTNEFDKATFSTTDDLKSAFAELASGQVQYVAAMPSSGRTRRTARATTCISWRSCSRRAATAWACRMRTPISSKRSPKPSPR